jgi:hypothetical protein
VLAELGGMGVERLAGRPAAISASKAVAALPRDERATGRPPLGRQRNVTAVAGPYEGMTAGPVPEPVEFRFLGGGIRDLTVGGRLVARWVPVGAQGASAIAGSTRVKLAWSREREVTGWIQRGRGSRTATARFSATHRFARV